MDRRLAGLAAVVAPLLAVPLGVAMSVTWEITGPGTFEGGPPGAATVGPWVAATFPLLDADGEPRWIFRGPFFLSLVLAFPMASRVASGATAAWARRALVGGMAVAAVAIGLEYSTPGYGWMFDLAALLAAIVGATAIGIGGLRRGGLARPDAWALALLPLLTVVGGFSVFWYMPPGLAIGLLLALAFVGGRAALGRNVAP